MAADGWSYVGYGPTVCPTCVVLLLRCGPNGSAGTSHPWPSDFLFWTFYDVKHKSSAVSSRGPAQSWVCRRLGRRVIVNFDDDNNIPQPHFGIVTSVTNTLRDRDTSGCLTTTTWSQLTWSQTTSKAHRLWGGRQLTPTIHVTVLLRWRAEKRKITPIKKVI